MCSRAGRLHVRNQMPTEPDTRLHKQKPGDHAQHQIDDGARLLGRIGQHLAGRPDELKVDRPPMMPVVSNSLPPEPITQPGIVSADKTPIRQISVPCSKDRKWPISEARKGLLL
jgi:hypothetical protein